MCEKELNQKIISELSNELNKVERSKKYKVGKNIVDGFSNIKSLNILKLLNTIIRHVVYPNLGCDTRSEEWKGYIKRKVAQGIRTKPQNEFATVYTCITGDYDSIVRTPVKSARTRYVLYTDNPRLDAPGWEIRSVPDNLKEYCPAYINRYIKLHPYKYFDTEFTIYIDGNIWLLTDIWEMCERAHESTTGISMFAHGYRDCVYEEARVCEILKRGNKEGIRKQIKSCAEAGVGHHSGLMEACVIVTDQTIKLSHTLYDVWWNEFQSNGSGRDQLALPAAVSKLGLCMADFGILGDNARVDNRLHFDEHKK